MYADGYNDEQASVELALQEIDKPHIEKFKTAIHSKHRLSYKTKTKAYRINIRSRQLCKALTKYGCSNHKSYTMDIPSGIPHMLISHFIRGYFVFILRKRETVKQDVLLLLRQAKNSQIIL